MDVRARGERGCVSLGNDRMRVFIRPKKKCGSLSSSLRAEILNSGDETRARTCGIVILLNGFVSSILRRRLRHSGLKFNAIGTA